jgi:hypothetical protein
MYLDELKTASAALADAARTVDHAALRRYLSLRSTALLSGDYYASDLAWLDLEDHAIDVVIGPIQTHDDRLLGLKASYQGAALVKDPRATRSLEVFRRHLPGMAASLPVEPRLRAVTEGEGGALEVMNVVRFAGDFNAGIKPVAASLPVDERVVQKAGAKKQIYRNVLEAKFDAILLPMARLLLRKDDQALLTREALLTNVLLHELAHGVGPAHVAGKDGRSVRRALRDLHAPIAEARADAAGIHALAYLREQEIFTREEVEECHATYLAGLLRAVRSGAGQPHSRAAALQLNILLREGGVEHDAKKGGFSVHPRKFEPAIAKLAALLLEIEGRGDAAGAAALLDGMGDPDPATAAALALADGVPVDVTFVYPL